METDKSLNAAEVMKILRVTRPTVRAMLQRGELRGFQRGRIIRIDRRSLERLLGGAAASEDRQERA